MATSWTAAAKFFLTNKSLDLGRSGHAVALKGGMAYRDMCKSNAPIAKAGGPRRPYYQSVREVALDGDIVRCRSAAPRRIAAVLALATWHDDLAESYTEAGTGPECYDEQFTLLDGRQPALPGTYYTLRYSCGSLLHGVTDGAGRTTRHRTHGARPVAVYLGHREN